MRTVKVFDIEDFRLVQCKSCAKFIKKYNAGYYPNQRDIKWCDEEGILFNGRVCPQCHSDKQIQTRKIISSVKHTAEYIKRSKEK
jgi:hypothetical protein